MPNNSNSIPDNTVPSVAAELVADGHRTGRGKPWVDRDRCGAGHLFTPENTLWRSDSSPNARRCRACANERNRRYYWERGGRERQYPGAGQPRGSS